MKNKNLKSYLCNKTISRGEVMISNTTYPILYFFTKS